jgi:hypothetical protein
MTSWIWWEKAGIPFRPWMNARDLSSWESCCENGFGGLSLPGAPSAGLDAEGSAVVMEACAVPSAESLVVLTGACLSGNTLVGKRAGFARSEAPHILQKRDPPGTWHRQRGQVKDSAAFCVVGTVLVVDSTCMFQKLRLAKRCLYASDGCGEQTRLAHLHILLFGKRWYYCRFSISGAAGGKDSCSRRSR